MKSDQTATVGRTTQSVAGLPESLKPALSDLLEGTVSVHYNSAKPADIDGSTCVQGSGIHLGAGPVKNPADGQVKPLEQTHGVPVNNDSALEREADKLGKEMAANSG